MRHFNPRDLYGTSARFDNATPLTDEQLQKAAPSIFAVAAHESRSERFQPIPTINVLNALRKEGFFPVACRQSAARGEGKQEFTKHLVRLRRFDNVEAYKVGDTIFEVILRNANDGSASYELLGGLFRIRCLNSLVTQTGTVDSVRVRHMGKDIPGQVIEGTYRVLSNAEACLAAPQDWSKITMLPAAKEALAEAAHLLRFGEQAPEVRQIKPAQLLAPRRADDKADDLWTTFNVVQEHCIKGGDRGMRRDEHNRLRHTTTREVNNIDRNVSLNKALWLVGERLAATLKVAA